MRMQPSDKTGNVIFTIRFDDEEYDLDYKDLVSVFAGVLEHPPYWCEPIEGDYTVFDELPPTKISSRRFALSFFAQLGLRIKADLTEGDREQGE